MHKRLPRRCLGARSFFRFIVKACALSIVFAYFGDELGHGYGVLAELTEEAKKRDEERDKKYSLTHTRLKLPSPFGAT